MLEVRIEGEGIRCIGCAVIVIVGIVVGAIPVGIRGADSGGNLLVFIAQAAGSAVFAVFLVIALSFYVVLDGGRRLNEALTVLPPRVEEEVRLVLRTFDEIFHGYVRGMMLVSLIYGVQIAPISEK